MPISATLAANEAMAARRARGQPVLPLAFGEAGLPADPLQRRALAAAAGANRYGPVAAHPALRSAAAGYWQRRGLPTSPAQVVCGPGSKPLLFSLLLATGGSRRPPHRVGGSDPARQPHRPSGQARRIAAAAPRQ